MFNLFIDKVLITFWNINRKEHQIIYIDLYAISLIHLLQLGNIRQRLVEKKSRLQIPLKQP